MTLDQVVALSRAGVSESVILAVIERDRTIFNIAPDQVVTLQQQGLSDAIIVALLRSGRLEGDQAAEADAAARAAAILSSLPVAPEVLIIGHGPDIPNTTHDGYAFYPGFDYPAPFPGITPPPVIPVPVPFGPAAYSGFGSTVFGAPFAYSGPRPATRRARATCLAQTSGLGRPGGPMPSRVTACPPAMQAPVNRAIR